MIALEEHPVQRHSGNALDDEDIQFQGVVGHHDITHSERFSKRVRAEGQAVTVIERWPHAVALDVDAKGVAHRGPSRGANPGDIVP